MIWPLLSDELLISAALDQMAYERMAEGRYDDATICIKASVRLVHSFADVVFLSAELGSVRDALMVSEARV